MELERPHKEEARQRLVDLVAAYDAQAPQLERPSSSYTETEARGEFVDRFLSLLGWDVHNHAGLPQIEREVVLERTASDEASATGRPDYRLRHQGRDRLVVEAKKPSVRLSSSTSAAIQARTYGWSLSLPASVLTNFAETVIYDTTITPSEHDGPDVAVIPGCRFTANEYITRFDYLWERLSYENVASHKFHEIYDYTEPPRGTSPFDRTFLDEFRRWRLVIAADIAQQNAFLHAPEIARRTQQLLNALLFLRICEDRNIAKYEDLLQHADSVRLVSAFRSADRVFNAGLFDVADNTQLSSSALANVIRQMYWPRSKFAFGALRPDILSALYEQYLAERIELRDDRTVELTEKPELTHAGGIVPTPQFVVDALLDEALKNLPQDGVPDSFSVLDPACGSGIFLLAILARMIIIEEEAGRHVGLSERSKLAQRHLYGIDLDGAAVEVTRLSLLLAVLGDASIDIQEVRNVLPDLSSNIRSGNTLIGTNFDDLVPSAAVIPERRAAVAPMDLAKAFETVAESGGFSVIISNPPYTRIQTMSRYLPDQLAYFQHPNSGLTSSQSHSFDIYLLFVERAFDLLSPDGRIAFIIPNRFTNSLAGAHVRNLLGPRLERLVHFGEEQVFEGRITYTALVIAGPKTSAPATFERVSDLPAWRAGAPGDVSQVNRDALTAAPWPISSAAQARMFTRMEAASIAKIGDPGWLHIFVGVQTSADNVYFISPLNEPSRHDTVRFKDNDGRVWEIESSILRKSARDRTIVPYDLDPLPDSRVIFPYKIEEPVGGGDRRRAKLLSRDEMAVHYPKALSYLSAYETLLRSRSVVPDPGDNFWAYGRSQSLAILDQPKLIARVLSPTPQYASDYHGLVVPGGGDGGPYYLLRPRPECPYRLELFVAILSHPAVDAFVASRGRAYRGSYIVHLKRFLVNVPVPNLTVRAQEQIVSLVQEVQGNVVRLRTESDHSLRRTLHDRNQVLRNDVEGIISGAYGLTDSEIQEGLG